MRPLSFRFSSIVACGALAAMACGNISLSSSASGFNGSPPAGLYDIDAAVDGGGGTLGPPSAADGSAPLTATGNPLCNYGFTATASHVCEPDSEPEQSQCGEALDASAVVEAAASEADAGALGPSEDGGGGGGSYDGGVGAPAVDASVAATVACHVVETTADGGARKTQMCSVVGAGQEGDQCEKSTDCDATYECVGMPGQCRHYCCGGNSVCSATNAPSFCDVQPVVSGKFDVPVCMPISGCSLFGKCPPSQTCAVVEDDGTTSCVNVGTAKVGDPCDEVHCASGLTCLGNDGSRTCSKLCHVDSSTECPAGTTCTGSAQLFKDPQFGICQ